MSRIKITDLAETSKLDRKTMKATVGGIAGTTPLRPADMLGIVTTGPVSPVETLGIVTSGPVKPADPRGILPITPF